MPEVEGCPVTLGVVTYNQAGLLRDFLRRFHRMAGANLKLILVDDGSTDATPDLLREESRSNQVVVARIEHAGAAAARNQALRLCQTPWLAFTDTDCILDEDYLRALLDLPRLYPQAAAIEGSVIPPGEPKPPLSHWLENPSGGQYATANLVVNVRQALAIHGFDEKFPGNLREDTDFGLRMGQAYGPLPFHRDLRVVHPYIPRNFTTSLLRAWKRQAQTVYAERRLYAKHPSAYALVRRLATAEDTIAWWRKRHALFFAKQGWPWVKAQSQLGAGAAVKAWVRYAGSITLALWEQACLQMLRFIPVGKQTVP